MNIRLSALATIVALALSACSTVDESTMSPHAGMNADQRCGMYRDTMEGKTAAERRTAAEIHIAAMHGSADPAHVDRHLQMMEQMCGPKTGGAAISR